MRYEISRNKLLDKGLFTITDDSGSPRFEVSGRHSLCDPSGEEQAAIKRHALGRQADILVGGQLMASVHVVGLGVSENYRVDGPAGQLAVSGDFFGHNYTLTLPDSRAIATVSQRRGFRERFDVETAPAQDDVMLLAVILAVEDLRDQKGTGAGALS